MPLSHSTITELRGELLSLKDRRRDIERRIAALESLLAAEPGGTEQGSLLPTPNGDAADALFSGLRASALNVLAKATRPMKAPEVAAVLSKQGFQNTGSTSLTTRVYNDLYRLSKSADVVVRDTAGRFRLAEVESQ